MALPPPPDGFELDEDTPNIVGRLRDGRPVVRNPDGSVSTHIEATVTDPRINGGQATNIPTMYGGRRVSAEEAQDIIAGNGGVDPDTGQALRGYPSIDDAEVDYMLREHPQIDREASWVNEQAGNQEPPLPPGFEIDPAPMPESEAAVRARLDAVGAKLDAKQKDRTALGAMNEFGRQIGDALVGGAEKTGVYMRAAKWLAHADDGDADELANAIAIDAEAAPERPAYSDQFDTDIKDAGWRYENAQGTRDRLSAIGEAIGTVVTSPRAVVRSVAEQAGNIIPGMGGAAAGAAAGSLAGPVGTAVGGYAGMAAGSVATEAGAKLIEMVQGEGVDIRDSKAVARVLKSPGFREKARKAGLIKGSVIAAVDLATMKVGGKILGGPAKQLEKTVTGYLAKEGVDIANKEAVSEALASPAAKAALAPAFAKYAAQSTVGRRAGRAAGAVGIETLGEGVGEGVGQVAGGGETSFADIAQEMIGSLGQSALQAGAEGAIQGANQFTRRPEARGQNPDIEMGDEPSIADLIGEDVTAPNTPLRPDVAPDATATNADPVGSEPYDGTEVSTLSPADLRIREIRDAINAGRPVPPGARGQAQELETEDVELAPPPEEPPKPALRQAAEELAAAMRERRPDTNIDVEEIQAVLEAIEAAQAPADAPVPKWTPPANVDVSEQDIEDIDAAQAPLDIDQEELDAEQIDLAPAPPEPPRPPDGPPAANIDVEEDDLIDMDAEAAQLANERAQASRAGRFPPGWTDARLGRAQFRYGLRKMVDDLVEGGGVTYKRDENDVITGRTPSLNPRWFKGMNEADETKMSVVATRLAVQKALAGEKLGVREARVIAGMLDEITGQRRDQVEYVKQELEKARRFRKTAAEAIGITDADVEQAGELFAEREYPADWDGPTRTLFELADEARAANAAEAQAILESGADNATVARRLLGVIHGRANTDVQGGPRQAEGEREAEAPAQAQGAQADAPAASDEAVAPPPASRSSEASAAQPPSVSLNSASTAASPPAVRAKSKPAPTVSPPAAQKPAKPAEPTADEQPAGARGARAQPEANTEKLIPGAQHRDAGSHAAQKASQGVPLSAKELSNIVRTESFIEKLDDLLKVPLDSEAGRPATNRIDSGSAPTKSLLNGVRTHAQSLRNILGGKSFSDQPFSSRDAKAQRLVLSNVFRLGHDSKVLGSVVKFIPVDVMDYLNGQKLSPKMVFHNRSVLKDALSIGFGSNVTAPRDLADSLVRAIALAGAEVSSGRVISDLEGPSKKLDAATGTLDNRHGVTPDSDAVLGAGDVGASSAPPTISESDSVETKDTDSGVMMFARMDEVETENGPAFDGDDIALFPQGKVPGSDDRYKFIVVDTAGGSTALAEVTLGVKDGEITRLHNIVVKPDIRQKGVGTRILRSILDTSSGSIEIRDIANSSLAFWKKVGTSDIQDTQHSRHGVLRRDDFDRATEGREAPDGMGRQAGADPARGSGAPRGEAQGEVTKAPERGLSVSEVRAYLERRVGRKAIAKLIESGRLQILSAGDGRVHPEAKRARVYGYATGDTTVMIADRLTDTGSNAGPLKDAFAIFMHETGVHYGMRRMLGDRLFEQVIQEVADAAKTGKGALADAARAARAKVPRATRPDHVDEEILAWLVTERANHSLPLVKRIIAKIQAFLVRMGFTKAVGPDALVELARGAAQRAADEKGEGGTRFARDDDSPVSRLLRRQKPAPLTPDAEKNRALREANTDIRTRAKRFLRRQLAPGGLLPEPVFKAKIERDNKMEVVEFDTKNLISKLEAAIKESYGKDARALNVATTEKLAAVLAGKSDPSIPDRVRVRLEAMRTYIDGLSKHYLAALHDDIKAMQAQAAAAGRATDGDAIRAKIDLFETIAGNIGQYVHRSYRAFDDPKWFKAVPDAVVSRARQYLTDRHVAKGETPAEAARLAEVAIHEILKTGTAYDSMEAFIKESKLGAKDLSVLKKREDIAPEIRALLGEYVDPRINFAKSTAKMSRLVFNHLFLKKVREVGMGAFLFEGTDRPPNATKQMAGDATEAYAPLNGLWTFPDVEQAFRDALGREQMANWYRHIVQVNGAVKFGKTVLSPTTAMRNFQSAMLFAVANGHFDMRHMAKSIAAAREYFKGYGDAKRTAYLRKMKQLGVVYDAPYAGEMMRLLEDSQAADWLASGKTATTIKQGLDFARKFYSYGDDFWKIIGFENEKRALMDTGMKEADAETEAAERIRNTYPTYSMVGRAVNSLRRFPLVGTFVSFPAEIIRTSYHMLRYVAADWKHPKRRGLAVRRAIGLAVAAGFAQAIQVMTMSMFGVDDDEEEAVRDLAAPWGRNSNFAFAGRDQNGDLRYFDLSFLDPYNYWKRPLIAITRDEPWEDKFKEIARETLTPFFGTDILAGTVFEIMANKTENGRPVYKSNDELTNQAVDVIDHLRKAVQPGLASNIERAFKAAEGEVSPSGRKFTAEDELAAWVGWRATTVNPRAALYYRSWEFKDAKGEAAQILRQTLNNPNEVDDDDLEDATSTARKRWEIAYKDFARVIHAARKAGLTDRQIRSVLLNSRVPAKDIHALMKGETPPMQLSAQSQSGAMKKADVLFDAETKGEIRERYNEARRMLREAAD